MIHYELLVLSFTKLQYSYTTNLQPRFSGFKR